MLYKPFFLSLILLLSLSFALDNDIGISPPMGWNGWNHFKCDLNEDIVKKTVDRMVELQLHKKGYVYVNIDGCWQRERNHTTGQIIVDSDKFPSGMAELGKYIHDRGLKFGITSDAGYLTCEGRPGSLGFEDIDAMTFASWGVDFLKYDDCFASGEPDILRYAKMRNALNRTTRPIFFSISNWNHDNAVTWGRFIGNSWRTYYDIEDKWESIISILDAQEGMEFYAGVGGWNDLDMLEVGNGGMSLNEYQAHFVLWAALKAPLLIGCDLEKAPDEVLNILGNEEIIGLNQDPLAIQARRVKRINFTNQIVDIYGGPLVNDRYALIFFNRGEHSTGAQISLRKQLQMVFTSYLSRDPLRHEDLAESDQDVLRVPLIGPHSVEVRIVRLKFYPGEETQEFEETEDQSFTPYHNLKGEFNQDE